MTNPWTNAVSAIESDWTASLPTGVKMLFQSEMAFVDGILVSEPELLKAATARPSELTQALLEQSRIGLSLNPAVSHAYLGVRHSRTCFLPGFRGLTEVALQEQLIKSCTPELVCCNDEFEWIDAVTSPVHHIKEPFDRKKRGAVVGGYCETKRIDDEIIVTRMSLEELLDVRSYALEHNPDAHSPWNDVTSVRIEQMYKKTLQRRNTDVWGFGNCPRMIAALSVNSIPQDVRTIERVEMDAPAGLASVDPEGDTEVTVSKQEASSVDYKAHIDNLFENASKYNAWNTYHSQVGESYGGNLEAMKYASSLLPQDTSNTPGAMKGVAK